MGFAGALSRWAFWYVHLGTRVPLGMYLHKCQSLCPREASLSPFSKLLARAASGLLVPGLGSESLTSFGFLMVPISL